MFHTFSQEELRSYCRTSIEAVEVWARRLIHEQMTAKYGVDFVHKTTANGEFLIKTDIRSHIDSMLASNQTRFSRAVDTLFLDHIIYFLCNPKWYKELFKPALDYIYPQGREEAREFLNRLVPIRNPLSHSNPISVRQAEQAICYSHDFVEGLKKYYKARGEERVWNVPQIVKVTDSLGNVFDRVNNDSSMGAFFRLPQELHCGETYSVEVEIDSSFSEQDYDVKWYVSGRGGNVFSSQKRLSITLEPKDVSTESTIRCLVVQKKEWHKFAYHDSRITLIFPVLPPA